MKKSTDTYTKSSAKALSIKELGIAFKETKSQVVYETLYKRVKPGLLNYIYNILKDRDEAKDMFTDVMMAVYNKIDQYNPEYNISTWIYRIAYTYSCYKIRNSKDRRNIPLSYFESSEESYSKIDALLYNKEISNSTSSSIEDYEEGKELLLQYAKKLPLEYREVLAYKYFYKMKNEEIAKKMKITVAKTKNLLNRGKSKLKEDLKDTNIRELMY